MLHFLLYVVISYISWVRSVVYRCGYEFCYVCEAEFKNKEQTCRCKKWDLVHNIIREQDGDEDDEDYDSEDDYESDYLDE